jgi:tetratricopeptide (TPR) repeat protein
VEVQLTVGTDGRVTDARVTRSMPPFDAPVVAAVRQWVFDARRLTAPITSTVLVTVTPPAQTSRARQATPAPGTPDTTRTPATLIPATPAPDIADASASREGINAAGRAAAAGESPQAGLRRLNGLLASAGTTGDARLQALRERAFLQATTGRTGLAERDLEVLLAANPRDADAYFTRGLAHFASATKTAIAAFNQVIDLQPSHLDAYRGRAWARLVAGDFDAARSDFDQVIRRERDSEAFRGRGWANLNDGRHAQADEDFSQLLRLSPTDPEAHAARAAARYLAGRVQEARADVVASMRIQPIRNRARTFNEVRFDDFMRFRRARALLDGRLKRNRNDADALLVAAAIAFRPFDDGGRAGGNRVEQDFTRAVQARPDVDALMARGMLYSTPFVRFDRDAAVADFTEVLRLSPNLVEAYMRRAIVRGTTAEGLADAVADAERALQLAPGDRRLTVLVDKLRDDHRRAELAKQQRAAFAAARQQTVEEMAAAFLVGLGIMMVAAEPGNLPAGENAALAGLQGLLSDPPKCRTSTGRPC